VAREGMHYLMEQAIVAMLTAGKHCANAPAQTYIVAPNRAETERPTAALHHYTAESKAWYYRFAWRHIATLGEKCWPIYDFGDVGDRGKLE